MVKFLYEGDQGIVIIESRDVWLAYKIEKTKLNFYVQYSPNGHVDQLTLKLSDDVSFAVEVNVKGKSSQSLEHLIISTDGLFRLRELTEEEQDKINKFKNSEDRCECFPGGTKDENSNDFDRV